MCSLTRAEKRRRITSLNLIARVCLVQPSMLLFFLIVRAHCWLMIETMPRSFSAQPLFSWEDHCMYWCLELLLLKCRALHFSSLNLMRFLSTHFSDCQGPSGWQYILLVHQSFLQILLILSFAEGTLCPSSKILF